MENYYIIGIEEFIPEGYEELEAVYAEMAEQEREVNLARKRGKDG